MSSRIKGLIDEISPLLHEGSKIEAARRVLVFTGQEGKPVREIAQADKILLSVLYDLLDNDDYELAAQLLWPITMFTPEPEFARRVWKELRTQEMLMLMGAASTSKSYSSGVFFLLDWVRDPKYTTVKVLGPSKTHLQDNLFSHLVNLHQSASLPLPGKVGELFIGMNTRNRRGSITGVIVPLGKSGAARLQGVKRFARKKAHPKFGILSRTRVLLDEAEQIPSGIWDDIDNITSTMTGDGGSIVACAFNPQDVTSSVGQRCEPPQGWEKLNADMDQEWTSTRDWRVIRLDGERCENVVQGKVVYAGLQTREGLARLKGGSGGSDSAGYYTFGRALYPPAGASFNIIPSALLTKLKARVIYIDKPMRFMGGDIALEGVDKAMAASGWFGLASAIEMPPTTTHPKGQMLYFKDEMGRARPRFAVYIDNLFPISKGDTNHVAAETKRIAMELGIQGMNVMLDRTGNGAGVHDLLKSIWSPDVMGVNYSSSASGLKIFEEDSQLPEDLYDRIQTELWFAFKRWLEHGSIFISPDVDTTKLYPQLTGRRYASGKISKVEPKKAYMSRSGNESPNEADAVMLIIQGIRQRLGIQLSVKKDTVDEDTLAAALQTDEGAFSGVTDEWDDLDD